MKFEFLNPKDITLTEAVDDEIVMGTADGMLEFEFSTSWEAKMSGYSFQHDGYSLTAVGPLVEMKRTGATADEAYENLVTDLNNEGWRLKA